MNYQNRTTEFFSLCQSLPADTASTAPPAASSSSPNTPGRYSSTTTTTANNPTSELASFHQTASYLSQKIYSTSTLLNQLTTLIQSRSGSLFVDDSSQVNTLVLQIKSSIETLNSELDGANVLIERNKRRTGAQAGLEANNMVGQLRDEFINTTKGFKDILKVRSERMKERNDRQSEVLGFDSTKVGGGGGEEEMMEESLLGNKPRIYEDKLMANTANSGGGGDNGFNNAMMGGGSALTGQNKMGGPRLDLTSAILGQQQSKQVGGGGGASNGMPGGESSMQLPRPYGGIRQRNTPSSSSTNLATYSSSSSSIYYNNNNNQSNNPESSSHLPVYSPVDLQRMEANSSQRQQLQLIPDQTYLRQRADAMSEVETNIVELGTIFNKLAVMVNEHEELVQRVEDNVDNASENIGLSMEVLADTMENLKTNRALFLKVFLILAVFVVLFITFFA